MKLGVYSTSLIPKAEAEIGGFLFEPSLDYVVGSRIARAAQ